MCPRDQRERDGQGMQGLYQKQGKSEEEEVKKTGCGSKKVLLLKFVRPF